MLENHEIYMQARNLTQKNAIKEIKEKVGKTTEYFSIGKNKTTLDGRFSAAELIIIAKYMRHFSRWLDSEEINEP